MKQLFEGQVYEILSIPNGIMFSYCKEALEDQVVVGYKMVSFDNGRMTDVAKNAYLGAKYGNNYQEIIKQCEHYITDRIIHLQNEKMLIYSKNGVLKLLNPDTSVLWQGALSYRNFFASDFVIYKNVLWACFPECDVMLRYSLSTMREELRIGGKTSPFNKPRSMFLENDDAYVCNVGSKKIVKVDLTDYTVSEFLEFPEEVYQYVKSDIYGFAILKSGLYMV